MKQGAFIVLSFLIFLFHQKTTAQPGNFYLPFNGNGQVYTNNSTIPGQNYYAYANCIQPDGKLLVGGDSFNSTSGFALSELLLVRYLPNGAPDSSFGLHGILIIDYPHLAELKNIWAIAVQPDGKIVITGYSSGGFNSRFIARRLPDGTKDESFGNNGWVFTALTGSIVSLPGNKLMMLSPHSIVGQVQQYLENGNTDPGFSLIIDSIDAFTRKSDQKILTAHRLLLNAAHFVRIKEYFPNGTRNLGFGNGGYIDVLIAQRPFILRSIRIDPQGKILLAGRIDIPDAVDPNILHEDIFLLRILPGGLPDLNFGTQGFVYTDWGMEDDIRDVQILGSGKILVSGNTYWQDDFFANMSIARYLPNGVPDADFIGGGKHVFALNPDFFCENMGMQLFENRIYLSGWGGDLVNRGMVSFCLGNDEPAVTATTQVAACQLNNFTQLFATATGTSYQWQVSIDGVSFSNLVNNSFYSAVNTAHLSLSNLPTSFTGYQYRCLVDGVPQLSHTIRFVNTWTGAVNDDWHNPGNWGCNSVPDQYTDAIVSFGKVKVNAAAAVRTLFVYATADVKVSEGVSFLVRE
jgi:uncharacterized delta-60 repeat protein